mmetsp:Transcript_23168/g.48196  ORF Transcript_23168/g.48196 Transcript_23168/m.48196 type:complete len:311 (+) Transcript_23168:50-982(+)
MWLMDALALSDGTISGLGKVLADRMPQLPPDELPKWCKNKGKKELAEMMTALVSDAYESSQVVRSYLDVECAKGRSFDEVYEEVRPILEAKTKRLATIDPAAQQELDADMGADDDDSSSFVAALLQSRRCRLPHERLQSMPEDPRVWKPPARGDIQREREDSRRYGCCTRTYPRASEVREPLMLVGSTNDWNIEQAAHNYTFKSTGASDPSCQESKLRIVIPAEGLRFQILSAKQGPRWRLTPSTQRQTLEDGGRGVVLVRIVDDKAGSATLESFEASFEIKGSGVSGTADVWVAISVEQGCDVWFVDLA